MTRYASFRIKGKNWFENVLSPKLSLVTPAPLLFTIIIMFSFKGEYIVQLPYHVLRITVPLALYFLIMWFLTFFIAVAMFGIYSNQAFATVIGPLLEVPILISLVNIALKLKQKLYAYPQTSLQIKS